MNLDMFQIEQKLLSFLKEETASIGFRRVVLGLSGGVDSAVTAVLCKKAFGADMSVVMIPSDTTNPVHMSHALMLCEKFDIEAEHVSIKNMLHSYPLELSTKLRKGNLAARLRMAVLYDVSASISTLLSVFSISFKSLSFSTAEINCALISSRFHQPGTSVY
jgi:NAD+ synthase